MLNKESRELAELVAKIEAEMEAEGIVVEKFIGVFPSEPPVYYQEDPAIYDCRCDCGCGANAIPLQNHLQDSITYKRP